MLRTDHRPLQWLQSIKEPKGRLGRWLAALGEYEFTVKHVPGKDNVAADALIVKVARTRSRSSGEWGKFN